MINSICENRIEYVINSIVNSRLNALGETTYLGDFAASFFVWFGYFSRINTG